MVVSMLHKLYLNVSPDSYSYCILINYKLTSVSSNENLGGFQVLSFQARKTHSSSL